MDSHLYIPKEVSKYLGNEEKENKDISRMIDDGGIGEGQSEVRKPSFPL